MAKPEKVVEDYLIASVGARGGWCAKMIDAGRRGAPDRECRFPRLYGKTIFVETKERNGKLKTWQTRYAKKLRDLGYVVTTCYTKDDVDQFMARYDRGFYD